MVMRIGLCGSHRTGKTTLSEALSQQLGIAWVKTDTRAIFERHGLHPAAPMDFKTRLWIQHRIIEAAIDIWPTEKTSFVTDRTPIDFMAYTLADIQGSTPVDFAKLEAYLTRGFEVTNQFFTTLVVIQPAIPLIYEEGKAALNQAYIEHLNMIIQGLCHDEQLNGPSIMVIKRHVTNLDERVKAVLELITG